MLLKTDFSYTGKCKCCFLKKYAPRSHKLLNENYILGVMVEIVLFYGFLFTVNAGADFVEGGMCWQHPIFLYLTFTHYMKVPYTEVAVRQQV